MKFDDKEKKSYRIFSGSSSSSNPNLFPQNLTNYYTNIFNPNVNTQFLQNAHAPNQEINMNYQTSQFFGPMNPNSVGILVSWTTQMNNRNEHCLAIISSDQQLIMLLFFKHDR